MVAPVKCEKCGKDFKSAHGLKVHDAVAHAVKAGPASKSAKKTKPTPKKKKSVSKTGAFVCNICGRDFKQAGHLGRHTSTIHAKAPRGKPAAAPAGIEVQTLTVDQLLTLKQQIDARLSNIVRQMKAAKVPL